MPGSLISSKALAYKIQPISIKNGQSNPFIDIDILGILVTVEQNEASVNDVHFIFDKPIIHVDKTEIPRSKDWTVEKTDTSVTFYTATNPLAPGTIASPFSFGITGGDPPGTQISQSPQNYPYTVEVFLTTGIDVEIPGTRKKFVYQPGEVAVAPEPSSALGLLAFGGTLCFNLVKKRNRK
ncbi:hypothetical protein NIES4074_61500 (plasmid) [Cylindrospermum sp. NIES-4074]|nr:hypothetical protein NIES4074_61500 [Cylindrospermum sp. NIES-4074]